MPSTSPPPETAVDTSPEVDALVELSFAVQIVLTRVAARHDLSVTQLRLLGILRDRTPSMAAIADYLALDRSSVTGLIDRAQARGLLVRRPSPDDARVTLIEISAAGRELGALLTREVTEAMAPIIAEHPSRRTAQDGRDFDRNRDHLGQFGDGSGSLVGA